MDYTTVTSQVGNTVITLGFWAIFKTFIFPVLIVLFLLFMIIYLSKINSNLIYCYIKSII